VAGNSTSGASRRIRLDIRKLDEQEQAYQLAYAKDPALFGQGVE
jgi:hypothetical protein